jgi:hypothetical protein
MWDFPDKVEDVSKIPAEYRMLYSEEGALLDTAKGIRDSLVGLDTTVGNLRKEADRNKKQGNDVVIAVNALLTEIGVESVEGLGEHIVTLNETIATKGKINPEKIREEIEAGYKKQITDLNGALTAKDVVLSNTILGRDVAQAVAKHGGNSDLLSPYVTTRLKMVEEKGIMEIRVLDADGDFVGDGKGGWQTPETFVGELKKDPKYHGAFAAQTPGPGGGGTPPGGTPPGGPQMGGDGKPIQKTPVQKINDGLRARGMGEQRQRQAGAATPPGMD